MENKMTNAQIEAKLIMLERNIADIQNTLSIMDKDIKTRTVLSDLTSVSTELQVLIRDNANAIVDIERRLATIVLPEETQYYLEAGDVETFKSNFSKLKAMMARFEKLYNNLVAYTSTRLNS